MAGECVLPCFTGIVVSCLLTLSSLPVPFTGPAMNLSHDRFLEVLSSLKAGDGISTDQRDSPRVALRASVIIAPCLGAKIVDGRCLDSQGKDAEPGPAFSVRVQDLSSGGVALQHFNAFPKGKLFVLDLPTRGQAGPGVRILCRAMHCRMTAEHSFLIGAQFVRIWTAPAPTLDAVQLAA